MDLLLVRHAKSSWKKPDDGDFERGLSRRGQRDAPDMALAVGSLGIRVDFLLCSSARRARQTATAFIGQLQLRTEQIRFDDQLYLATAPALLAALRGAPACQTLMLIGHNPGLTDLANLLASGPVTDNVPTAGIVHLRTSGPGTGLTNGCATLVHFLTPRTQRGASN